MKTREIEKMNLLIPNEIIIIKNNFEKRWNWWCRFFFKGENWKYLYHSIHQKQMVSQWFNFQRDKFIFSITNIINNKKLKINNQNNWINLFLSSFHLGLNFFLLFWLNKMNFLYNKNFLTEFALKRTVWIMLIQNWFICISTSFIWSKQS